MATPTRAAGHGPKAPQRQPHVVPTERPRPKSVEARRRGARTTGAPRRDVRRPRSRGRRERAFPSGSDVRSRSCPATPFSAFFLGKFGGLAVRCIDRRAWLAWKVSGVEDSLLFSITSAVGIKTNQMNNLQTLLFSMFCHVPPVRHMPPTLPSLR